MNNISYFMNSDTETVVYWLVLILSFLLVLIVVPRFHFYTPDGDVKNYYQEDIDYDKTYDKLLRKLYKLSLYDYCRVKWHYTFLLSLISSVFLMYLVNAASISNIIISTLLFFIVLEVPARLETAHVYSGRSHQATLIYSALMDRKNSHREK